MSNRWHLVSTRLTISALTLAIMVCMSLPAPAQGQAYAKKDSFSQTMLASRTAMKASGADGEELGKLYQKIRLQIMGDFPVESDWMLQDNENNLRRWFDAGDNADIEMKMIARVLDEIGSKGAKLDSAFENLKQKKVAANDKQWLDLYGKACEARRTARLARFIHTGQRIVFTKHFNMGGSHYAYTEAQSDAQAERQYQAGTSLCILEMDGIYGKIETLIDDRKGVIRDPGVSYDGKTILFSWKKSDREDDYHLYEMDARTRKITQITFGLGFADYEADYLPNDDIIFNSTRCVQIVDCWWTEVSNLYTCDRKGQFLRRLTFDQVHTNFPTILDDGTVIYTRWDYNDRGQLYPQPLYQMNPDGTAQREFYGNNSWFPTTILHARGIPGTNKVIAIATGHHSRQTGKLIIIDPVMGRQENQGVQLIAPVRETKAERIDAYGQNGELFQYPYPFSETEYLVTYSPFGWAQQPVLFNIYYMTIDGKRELLASDPKVPCNQPIPLAPRPRPHLRPQMVDYRKADGTYYVQDIYAGQSLKGVPRGTVKKLRVVEIQFRAAGVGSNRNGGPAGGALVSTPVSIDNGTWDVKVVLGDAKVYEDGSVCFNVPARTPVYFQAIDEKGLVVQSMRSWSTLQPGETLSCTGCHEDKNEAPVVTAKPTIAMRLGPQKLKPFYGPARGFSFNREIQPILDKHCIRCHNDKTQKRGLRADKTIQLLEDPKNVRTIFPRQDQWRYTTEKVAKGWEKTDYDDSAWKTGKAGFGQEGTAGATVQTRWDTKRIWLRRKFELSADPANQRLVVDLHHDEDVDIYINGVRVLQRKGHVGEYKKMLLSSDASKALKTGENVIAVSCRNGEGGQNIDLALLAIDAPANKTPDATRAFSLLDTPNCDNGARRAWSDSYLALTAGGNPDKGPVRWLNVQSIPPLLPPYFAGSPKSPIIEMLENGHNDVKLSYEETEKIACWIDLLVPYCGDYFEGNCWNENELKKYLHFQAKRDTMAVTEADNIRNMISPQKPAPGLLPSAEQILNPYRNLAINPHDVQGYARSWPHASSNSEYHDMPAFAALNAINGNTSNKGHGGNFPSWGPDKLKGLWWKLDFGRLVEIDKITLYIRADFPHDDNWQTATIEFSDGTKESIKIERTAEPQEFKFDKRIVSSIRLTDLLETEPLGWCGLTEVQAWGRDVYAPPSRLAGLYNP